ERGFTFLETAAIIVVIGILAAVAVARINSTDTYATSSELERVESHLRYAQGKAIRTNSSWGIRFNSSNTYWLFQTTTANKKGIAGEGQTDITLSNLSITSAPQTITFDGFGSPGAAGITVSTSGGNITIAANTGFIP
ncbi:MAG: hypothetical protein EG826_15555, partial [Deltaproteobacteria bacterium]|nr:hypothetical protein [Deltaproteobacteria bacterium]